MMSDCWFQVVDAPSEEILPQVRNTAITPWPVSNAQVSPPVAVGPPFFYLGLPRILGVDRLRRPPRPLSIGLPRGLRWRELGRPDPLR
jgi:hypothetical protein